MVSTPRAAEPSTSCANSPAGPRCRSSRSVSTAGTSCGISPGHPAGAGREEGPGGLEVAAEAAPAAAGPVGEEAAGRAAAADRAEGLAGDPAAEAGRGEASTA